MIRINLLATEKRVEKAAAAEAAAAAPTRAPISSLYLFLALAGLAGLVLAGGLWLWQSSQLKTLDAEITQLQAKERELQAVKTQVEAFEAKKKTLTEKVTLIERLKADQSSPVHLLDEISKALPDLVWLTNLDQTGGDVRLTGESTSFTAVADFITNLQRSGWFSTVELVSSDEQEVRGATGVPVVRFVLRAPFVNPEVAAKTPPSPSPSPATAQGRARKS